MLKRILFILLFAAGSFGIVYPQSQLRVTSLINFPDTAFEGVIYPVELTLANVGAAPFQGPIQVLVKGDSAQQAGILFFDNSAQFTLMPGDTALLTANPSGTGGFMFDSSVFRPGNDIVVVWPYSTQFNVGIDTLYTAVYFVPLSAINKYVREPIRIFPNPFSDIINLDLDPYEKVEQVRITDATGKLVATQLPSGRRLNLSFLEKGFYLLEVRTDHKVFFSRMVRD
jgi:hypothetical protein